MRRFALAGLGFAVACASARREAPQSPPPTPASAPPEPLYDDPSLQRYLEARASCLAREAGVTPAVFVLDEPDVGAWALPDGGVAVTRGLLALLRSEAELEAVLAHELAHLELGHADAVESAPVDDPTSVFEIPGLVMHAARDAAHSRTDERAADQRSIELLERCGRTALATGELFAVLEALEDDEGGGFFSSHPSTQSRRHHALAQVGPARPDPGRREYLEAIDGLRLGEDPRRGYVRGDHFVAPKLDLDAPLPPGWSTHVEDGVLLLEQPAISGWAILAPIEAPDPETMIQGFLDTAEVANTGVETSTVYAWSVTTSTFAVEEKGAIIACLRRGDVDLLLFAFVERAHWDAFTTDVTALVAGLGRIEDASLRAVEPLRIRVLELEEAATLAEVAERDDCDLDAAELGRLNGVAEGARLPAGMAIKVGRGS